MCARDRSLELDSGKTLLIWTIWVDTDSAIVGRFGLLTPVLLYRLLRAHKPANTKFKKKSSKNVTFSLFSPSSQEQGHHEKHK